MKNVWNGFTCCFDSCGLKDNVNEACVYSLTFDPFSLYGFFFNHEISSGKLVCWFLIVPSFSLIHSLVDYKGLSEPGVSISSRRRKVSSAN